MSVEQIETLLREVVEHGDENLAEAYFRIKGQLLEPVRKDRFKSRLIEDLYTLFDTQSTYRENVPAIARILYAVYTLGGYYA